MPSDDPFGHKPYVPPWVTMPEFTWSAVLVGVILGIVFGASSLYLVLRVGMMTTGWVAWAATIALSRPIVSGKS